MHFTALPKVLFTPVLRVCAVLIALSFQTGAFAQDAAYDSLMNCYHALDIAYFENPEAALAEHPFYQALQARIVGDTERYIKFLKRCIEQAATDTLAQSYASELFLAYAFNQQRDEALALRKQYQLNWSTKHPLDLKSQDYPAPSAEMEGNQTSVPFDQFYFDAIVNGTDTVRVFFDTGAPGVSVSRELVERYGWPTDTSYFGFSALPAFDIQFKNYPTVIPEIKIGSLRLRNLFAKYGDLTEEEQERMASSGVEEHDILLGLNALDGLVDGVAFDFKDSLLHITKTLPEKDAPMNFMFAEGKPAVRLSIAGTTHNAFLDTGAPRHVVPKPVIEAASATFNREAKYGSFTYKIYDLKYDQVLNLEDVFLETADYGFTASEDFNINVLMGSFLGRELYFDLRNRIVELR